MPERRTHPLETIGLDPDRIELLRAHGVRTVEALVALGALARRQPVLRVGLMHVLGCERPEHLEAILDRARSALPAELCQALESPPPLDRPLGALRPEDRPEGSREQASGEEADRDTEEPREEEEER